MGIGGPMRKAKAARCWSDKILSLCSLSYGQISTFLARKMGEIMNLLFFIGLVRHTDQGPVELFNPQLKLNLVFETQSSGDGQ